MSQTAEAVTYDDSASVETEQIVAPAALSAGDVIQCADGKAGIVLGANNASDAFASGERVTVAKTGRFKVLKTASIVLLDGGKAYFDRSANTATYAPGSGDFYLGRVVGDAAASDVTVVVDLNVQPQYQIELGKGEWTNAATDGLGVTQPSLGSPILKLAFDAVAEVAMAALYSTDTIPVADGPIFECKLAIYDIGDDAALDINFGVANGTHGTDFDSVTESAVFHLDGSDLSVSVESDDGTTEVAADDTGVDLVDDTFAYFWIDCRDLANIKYYINGVRVDDTAVLHKLDNATGPLLAIVHVEKTSNDTTADVRVEQMTVRSTDLTSSVPAAA